MDANICKLLTNDAGIFRFFEDVFNNLLKFIDFLFQVFKAWYLNKRSGEIIFDGCLYVKLPFPHVLKKYFTPSKAGCKFVPKKNSRVYCCFRNK